MTVTRRHLPLLVLLAACSPLLLACGTTGSDSSDDTAASAATDAPGTGTPETTESVTSAPSDTSAAPATDPADTAPTATAAPDTSPLQIGITYISNDQTSSELGAESVAINQKSIVQGLVAGINADGGLNGRQLEPVEYEWDSSSDDWSLDASAACAMFTQDNDVSIVLDTAFGTVGGFRSCLEDAGVASIQTLSEGSAASSAAATLHANPSSMTVDRAYVSVLDGLTGTDYLTADNQVGVIVENCPDNVTAYDETIKPLITSLGLKEPIDASVDCATGFAAATAASAAVNNAVLKFNDAGVDRVMFIGDNEYILLLFFSGAASSQAYTPGYLLSSNAQPNAMLTSLAVDQQPQMHGVGNQPFNDIDSAELSAVDQRCVELASAGGVNPVTYGDKGLLVFECAPFLLLEAALQATNGSAIATDLAEAISALDTTYVGPGIVEGATRFSDTDRDGPAMVRVFEFDDSCSCLQYTGEPVPA